jgi:arylsulfatase A-like enzyme
VSAGTSDILPTILDLAGIAVPVRPLDGISLKPLFEGKEFEHPPIGFWSYPTAAEQKNPSWLAANDLRGVAHQRSPRPPARFYNFRHPVPKLGGFTGEAAWMDGRWKLVAREDAFAAGARRKPKQRFQLFDLAQDPGEQRNVAAQNAEVVARMREELSRWQGSVERSLSGADYAPEVTQ